MSTMAQIESVRDALQRRGVDVELPDVVDLTKKLLEGGVPAQWEQWLVYVEAAADGYVDGQRAYDEEHA